MSTYVSTKSKRPFKAEIFVLGSISILILIGIITSFTNEFWFEHVYLREDSFVENITLIPLLIAVVIAANYLYKLARIRSWMFSLCMTFAIVFSIFATGEEISWGQRIFDFQSSQFFKQNNSQQETNLHNLIVEGKKVNKIVFSIFLFIAVSFYLLVLPFLYRKNSRVNSFIDWAGIPIAHRIEVIAIILVIATTSIIQNGKRAELVEMGITGIFLLILLYPENRHVFRTAER